VDENAPSADVTAADVVAAAADEDAVNAAVDDNAAV
jgi:hypothetical protein